MHVDLYERVWIYLTLGLLVVFMAAVGYSVFAAGIALPDAHKTVDPLTVASQPPFDEPGVVEVGPNQYEVYMVAQIWSFRPNEIKVPVGSEVTFFITSTDLTHGFQIKDTHANAMILPGQITRTKATFDAPGEYPFVCHEYCGAGHHIMAGRVIVE